MKISFTGLSDKSFVENNTVGKGRIWRRDSGEGVDVYITKSPASACWDIFDIYTPEYVTIKGILLCWMGAKTMC